MTKKTSESDYQRLEAAKVLLGSWQTHYWDSSKLLAQAWAFYFTIMAALIGYIMTRDLNSALTARLISGAMAITVVQILGATIWGWGLLKLVAIIEALNVEIGRSLFTELELRSTFVRWRAVVAMVLIGSATVAAIILIGLQFLAEPG